MSFVIVNIKQVFWQQEDKDSPQAYRSIQLLSYQGEIVDI